MKGCFVDSEAWLSANMFMVNKQTNKKTELVIFQPKTEPKFTLVRIAHAACAVNFPTSLATEKCIYVLLLLLRY